MNTVRARSASPSADSIDAAKLPAFLGKPGTFLPPILIGLTCIKILLMPAYRSTDFDVHRNWLAITHRLPLSEWYFDNINGTTVHTLDYPPAFAFFEYILANNPLTNNLLHDNDKCLELLSDSNNVPSSECVIFQRSTVILCDIILWVGAWMACRAFHHGKHKHQATLCFLLIVVNPGLLWLDHIHFQYNGMLLGVLLASLGLLMKGNHLPSSTLSYDLCHLGGGALYGLLLNLKHLYLPLAPIYFCYLFKKYCLKERQLLVGRFLALALVTTGSLVLPWVPFLIQEHPDDQLLQILARLFPFGRGLVHDYWAANVWVFFCLADKAVRFVGSRIPGFPLDSLPEPTPLVCAGLLLLAILPGAITVSTQQSNTKLIQSVVYTSFCAFMLAYHVHEKAILTALIPLTLLVEHDPYSSMHNFLFFQSSLWGLLGLFPLLFRPVELAFKLVSYFTYLGLASFLMSTPSSFVQRRQQFSVALVAIVISILEFVPIHGKWEFMPLMATSMVCAQGLVGCWALSLWLLLKREAKPKEKAKTA